MSSFREQMNQIRREYRKEVTRLDTRLIEIERKSDQGLERLALRMQTMRDEAAAAVNDIQELREDNKELSRTLTGRNRLFEERYDKMLEAFESRLDSEIVTDVKDLKVRVQALEREPG